MREPKKIKTPTNKTKVIEELTQAFKEDDAPPELIQLWQVQGDMCYAAFLAGKMVAKRMFLEGDITEDQITEVAMEWAKLLVMKVSYKPVEPPPTPKYGIITPEQQGPLSLQ